MVCILFDNLQYLVLYAQNSTFLTFQLELSKHAKNARRTGVDWFRRDDVRILFGLKLATHYGSGRPTNLHAHDATAHVRYSFNQYVDPSFIQTERSQIMNN